MIASGTHSLVWGRRQPWYGSTGASLMIVSRLLEVQSLYSSLLCYNFVDYTVKYQSKIKKKAPSISSHTQQG